jgi:hypothetical protein
MDSFYRFSQIDNVNRHWHIAKPIGKFTMSDKEDNLKEEASDKEVTGTEPESPVKAKPSSGLSHHVVPTERCGAFNVYVQVVYQQQSTF